MPNHETHCEHSFQRYGRRFSELHRWMDEPSRGLGPRHQVLRHDLKTTPAEARGLFGEWADQAAIDHILLDLRHREHRGGSGVLPSSRSVRVGASGPRASR